MIETKSVPRYAFAIPHLDGNAYVLYDHTYNGQQVIFTSEEPETITRWGKMASGLGGVAIDLQGAIRSGIVQGSKVVDISRDVLGPIAEIDNSLPPIDETLASKVGRLDFRDLEDLGKYKKNYRPINKFNTLVEELSAYDSPKLRRRIEG